MIVYHVTTKDKHNEWLSILQEASPRWAWLEHLPREAWTTSTGSSQCGLKTFLRWATYTSLRLNQVDKNHFGCLYSLPCSFNHYPQLVTIGEDSGQPSPNSFFYTTASTLHQTPTAPPVGGLTGGWTHVSFLELTWAPLEEPGQHALSMCRFPRPGSRAGAVLHQEARDL